MTREELEIILKNHLHWLNEDCEGWETMRANLSGADLSEADLSEADLYGTNLSGTNLSGANLSGADLSEADLSEADLYGTNLSEANLRGANLSGTNLFRANLFGADLSEADLRGAKLRGAKLSGAKNVPYIPMACPSDGDFIGWKKCRAHGKDNEPLIVKLLIPEDARRTSATGRKCRCDKAVVLEVQTVDGEAVDKTAYSTWHNSQSFAYKVGETVTPEKDFCEDRWKECESGIHFFINRQEAVEYKP